MYNILMLRLKTREELEGEDEAAAQNYEDKLLKADVANLSRAERRARARAIMKQQRRVQPNNHPRPNDNNDAAGGDGNGEPQAIVAAAAAEQNIDDETESATHHLSRKERLRRAKAIEKEERKSKGEERRQQQRELEEVARKEKRERERLQALESERDRERKRLLQQEEERKKQMAWNTFLACERETLTVDDWREELQSQQTVLIDDLAERFSVSPEQVSSRIRDLIRENRLKGIITTRGLFIQVSQQHLSQLDDYIRQKGRVSKEELVDACQRILTTA